MKERPVSHKNKNTFHFLTFAEHLKNIDVSLLRRKDLQSTPDGRNTYFWEAFEKWRDLDYTVYYEDFRKDVGDGIENINQIVHRKDEVIQILLKHLSREGSLALPALLELTVALARDLQCDLYPHFPALFTAVTSHMSTKDTELLEKLFLCLEYLFKSLWRYMVNDMHNVYKLFSSLLADSNKEHIKTIACMGFAFLIRKVLQVRSKKEEQLFIFIFKGLQKHPEQTFGVGQLLFEVVKGVKEQFHSSTEKVLKLLLKNLGNEDLSPDLVEQALFQTITSMAKHTVQKHCVVVQQVFSVVIKELLLSSKSGEALEKSKICHLEHILRLLLFWIKFKDGKLLTSDKDMADLVVQLCSTSDLPISCMKTVVEIASTTLLTGGLNLAIDKIRISISQIFSHSKEVAFFFTRNMFDYGMFEKDILPPLLSTCLEMLKEKDKNTENKVLEMLSETITTLKPVVSSGDDLKSFSKLYLHVDSSKILSDKPSTLYILLEDLVLKVLQSPVTKGSLQQMWSALVCLPHIRHLNVDRALSTLQEMSQKFHSVLMLTEWSNSKTAEEYGFVLCQAYFVTLVVGNGANDNTCFNLDFFTTLLKKFPQSISVLRMVDYFLNSLSESPVLDDVISTIIPNLASPLNLVRMFTLRILKTFKLQARKTNETASVFTLCFEAEQIPADVQNYRDKLKWLRKLEYEFVEKDMPAAYEDCLKQAVIYYLFGMLYVNFKLLWDPCLLILETYAHGTTKLFWDLFSPHLIKTIEACEKFNSSNDDLVSVSNNKTKVDDAYFQTFKQLCEPSEKADVLNHRLLLCKAMELFPDILEIKNKTIVPLLFQFMVNEVSKNITIIAPSEDVNRKLSSDNSKLEFQEEQEVLNEMEAVIPAAKRKRKFQNPTEAKRSKLDESIDNKEDMDEELDESVDNEEDEMNSEEDGDSAEECLDEDLDVEELEESQITPLGKKVYATRRFHVAKTLAAYLSVFAKYKNPKGGYKVEELQKLYCELLSYHDPVIQKLAFDCIMTFNYKFLNPYRENFYRILDNKTFKTEVVVFNLDADNQVIQEEHRMQTLSILMRILYGKMIYKTGSNTQGKNLANARRSIVLRFLAGCRAEELKMFFELVFTPFKELLNDDTYTAVQKIRNSMDLSSIVPIRRQHSALNMLGLIFQHLGNLVPGLLPYLLKVLLIVTATSTTLLEKRNEVLPQVITLLKSVRTLSVLKLIQFFKTFEDYKFLPEEVDSIFDSFVWSLLPRLEFDSLNQPSPLLRLFAMWSEKPRYFILFAKHHEQSEALTPLKHIMDLYSARRTKAKVVAVVSRIVCQLLTAESKAQEEEGAEDEKKPINPIELNFCIDLPDITVDGVPCYLGNKLMQPYVDKVLFRFEMTVSRLSRNKFKALPTKDLNILLRISQFIEDGKQCFKLIQLLPPFLLKPKTDSDSEVLILNTISNLLKKSENPDCFVQLFAPLFGKLTNQYSRTALVNVFVTLAEIKPELRKLTNIISKVNAFDSTLIGEPDYQSRLDGHRETLDIIRATEDATSSKDFIRIVIFNSSYMIKTCDDLALRTSSSYMLQQLTKLLSESVSSSKELTQSLLYDTLLLEIQKGLKSTSESVRHEFLSVLSSVLHCWSTQPGLKDLVVLCNEDKELDFWENIRHLQVHRRARALLRFANILKAQCENKESVSVHYLTAYMIPLVSSFLFDAAYKKNVHVIDAAIETLGCIALALPWHHYETILRQYLKLLSTDVEHHKTIVKIIVSILNAFHFKTSAVKTATVPRISDGLQKAEEISVSDLTDPVLKEASVDPNDTDVIMSEVAPVVADTTAAEFKIYVTIKKNILPLLHRSLMKKSRSDNEHKLAAAGNYFSEDDEVLRVPIALAMVKLLQNLPVESLEKNLPGLFLKMCDLLKSKSDGIRETTRETLVKMMESLGPKYFQCLLKEMKGVMKRGYQVHVMTYTINAILTKIVSQMEPSVLDRSCSDLIEVCTTELFTDIAEEKEVEKITAKLKEARSFRSYSILEVLSQFVSGNYLLEIIKPLKEELVKKHNHKVMKKVSECLRSIALGMSQNRSVTNEKQLVFIHGVMNESMPGINKKKKIASTKTLKYERPDCFLIAKEPGRSGPAAKVNERTTDHMFVEFGLQIFQFLLKKDKIDKTRKEILEMLDPFVPLLADCLASNHMRIVTTALRCLWPLYKFSLPSFKTTSSKIVSSLFVLVNKYAAVGMGQGENFEMIVMCFKVFTVLVRDTSYHSLSNEQLQSLLSYIEQDIYDYTRQATAFTLLKAILSKKLQAPELRGIMSKIAEMSITAEQDYVRSQCRQVCLQYMLDYPIGKQLLKSISFFIGQLEYHHEHGRVSTLEVINSMLNHFPENVLQKHSALFLVPLSARLVNDESSECRKMSAQCIKKLLTKVQHDGRATLFSVPFTWLEGEKISHKRLGAQLCGLYAEVEKEQFEHHLKEILPIVSQLISTAKNEEVNPSADERTTDHFLYHILNSLTKMLGFCNVIKKKEFSDVLSALWSELQGLILYPHLWVRLATSQLFGLLLSTYTVIEIKDAICEKKKNNSIYLNSRQKLRDFSADFATQLQSPFLNEKLGEQVIRNLVYLARVIAELPEDEEDPVEVSLDWIIRKLCREAKKEVADQPTVIQRRKCVFTFMAAFAHEMGRERLLPLLKPMLLPLCREVSDNSKYPNEELRKCSQEVMDLVQNVVGVEDFTSAFADVQTLLLRKKVKRKQEKAKEAVTNPESYAKKKIKKQLSKKESKKRRIMHLKGKKKPKKTKLADLVINT